MQRERRGNVQGLGAVDEVWKRKDRADVRVVDFEIVVIVVEANERMTNAWSLEKTQRPGGGRSDAKFATGKQSAGKQRRRRVLRVDRTGIDRAARERGWSGRPEQSAVCTGTNSGTRRVGCRGPVHRRIVERGPGRIGEHGGRQNGRVQCRVPVAQRARGRTRERVAKQPAHTRAARSNRVRIEGGRGSGDRTTAKRVATAYWAGRGEWVGRRGRWNRKTEVAGRGRRIGRTERRQPSLRIRIEPLCSKRRRQGEPCETGHDFQRHDRDELIGPSRRTITAQRFPARTSARRDRGSTHAFPLRIPPLGRQVLGPAEGELERNFKKIRSEPDGPKPQFHDIAVMSRRRVAKITSRLGGQVADFRRCPVVFKRFADQPIGVRSKNIFSMSVPGSVKKLSG